MPCRRSPPAVLAAANALALVITVAGRRSSTTIAILGSLVFLGAGCATHVTASRPVEDTMNALGCVAVLPFANNTSSARAGDLIAEMVAGSLVLSDRYSIVEPAEVRGFIDSRGLVVSAPASVAGARAVGEALGVDAVLAGSVRRFGGLGEAVAFSAQIIDVRKGGVLWSGEVSYAAEDQAAVQPVLAGFAEEASNELLAAVIAEREPPAAHRFCAKPKTPPLASKTSRPAASDRVAANLPASGTAVPTASTLSAMPSASTGPVVSEALPALPPAPTPAPSITSTGKGGDRDLAALPPLPDLDTRTPAGSRTPSTDSGLPALPALSDLPAAPPTGADPLPALPPIAETADAGGLPALPALPENFGSESAGGTSGLGDLPAVPALPDLPAVGDTTGLAADEYAGLPYAPAAPETPPAPKGKISGRQRALMRQLYVGTGVIRRFFKTGSAALQRKANGLIADFLGLLKATPDLKLAFEVHADVGTAPGRSQQLSERQLAVLQKLVESKYPIARGRVFFRSLGNGRPIAKDVSARARAQNTRVEIRRVY